MTAAPGVVRWAIEGDPAPTQARTVSALSADIAAALAGPDHDSIERAAAQVLGDWRTSLGTGFKNAGLPADQAESFAGFVFSAIEGALLQARASHSEQPSTKQPPT